MFEPKESHKKKLLPSLGALISKYQMSAKKSLGQHFLLDTNLTDKIAKIAKVENSTVVEVGPGPGGLTRSILAHGARKLITVEKDSACIEALEDLQRIYPDRLKIFEADAVNLNLSQIVSQPYKIVSNLPYNVSTPLLVGWLKNIKYIERMTLTFQKEVADRIAARPSTKDYGRLSIITQWLCEVKIEFNITPRAFVPPPNVISSVVTLIPRKKPLAPADWACLEKVTSAAFNQRRKMLRSSLKRFNFNYSSLEIDPTLRAENLTVEEFCHLARSIRN